MIGWRGMRRHAPQFLGRELAVILNEVKDLS
jgi:hypothetical protein